MKSNIYIIGCGGVGSWLTPALALLTGPENIILLDADKLEPKNLNRQLFTKQDVGRIKAEALAQRYGCQFREEWFTEGLLEFEQEDWVIVCVDNHMARRAALYEADRFGFQVILAANETHSAEAYYYQRRFQDSPIDPRKYYPDILTDNSNNPRRAVIGCTGEVQQQNPQLVTSNALAAALAGHLFALWHLKAKKFKQETIASLPYHLVASMTRLQTHLIKDKITERTQNEQSNTSESGATPAANDGVLVGESQSVGNDSGETAGAGEH